MVYLCILLAFKHWNCGLNPSSDFKYHLKLFLLFLGLQYNYTIFLFVHRLCHLVTSEITAKMSHQYDCLDMSQTRTKIDMPQWMGEGKHKVSTLHREYSKIKDAESRRNSPPQRRAQQLIIQQQIVSPVYIQATLYRLNKLYLKIYNIKHTNICTLYFKYICICMHVVNH